MSDRDAKANKARRQQFDEMERRVTFRMADGSLIYGEYDYVHDTEYFEGADEPVEVIREVWHRTNKRPFTIHPTGGRQ